MQNVASPRSPWVTGILSMACLAAAGLASLGHQLAYDRQDIMAGEIWRLWTGHLVHFSSQQFLLDVGSLLGVGWLAERQWGARFTGLAVLLGMPAISIGLLLMSPELIQYRGISGIVMLLAVAAATHLWSTHPNARPVLFMLGLALAIKTVLDALDWSITSSLPAGVGVAWQAHLVGATIGWIAARHQLGRSGPSGAHQ